MNKMKRYFKNTLNYLKGMRISTIYKLVGIVLFFAILFWIYSVWKQNNNFKEKTQNEVVLSGTIINKGEDYIIIEDLAKNKYLISIDATENYPIGSDVEANIKNVIEQGSKDNPTIVSSDKINVINEKKENKNADADVLTFFKETENDLKDPNLQEEVKVRFISIVDFLFYNGTITGYTFNDVTSKTKLQILKIALSIDSKIESYLPGYKETITSTTGKIYTGLKIKIIENYLNTTTKICNYDKNLCETAKEDFQEMKKTFSITWNYIKDLIINATENLKEWYEIYSGKTS